MVDFTSVIERGRLKKKELQDELVKIPEDAPMHDAIKFAINVLDELLINKKGKEE